MEHWTAEQYNSYVNKPVSKLCNVRTEVDGISFPSQLEANRYCELKILKQQNLIRGFARQPSFFLSKGVRYIADFIVCGLDGHIWIEDTKGCETKDFKIKEKLFREIYPWLELKILK